MNSCGPGTQGKLIVLEGLDCSFKETNSIKLLEYLKEKSSVPVFKFSFPRYEKKSAWFVKQYLSGAYGRDPKDVNYSLASVFYMMDQFHNWKTIISKLYDSGSIIILDRFWTSNIYHQCSKLVSDDKIYVDRARNEIIHLATRTFNLPYPDIIFNMRMKYDNIIDLLVRKNSHNDIHEGKKDYILNVYNYYKDLEMHNSKSIYCDEQLIHPEEIKPKLRSEDEIFNDIKVIVDHSLSNLYKKD